MKPDPLEVVVAAMLELLRRPRRRSDYVLVSE